MKSHVTREQIEAYQVERFNVIWNCARNSVPFYQRWQRKFRLPDAIRSLSELRDWPILDKSDLRNLGEFERKDAVLPHSYIITAGSTGVPVRLPSWPDWSTGVSQTVGRRAYGVNPGDRVFLLWGHEHLYGYGLRRRFNILKRHVKDWLSNWCRESAYDLGFERMTEAYARFSRQQPACVIGFSPAILAFVRQNAVHKGEYKALKAVVCTAGPLSASEKVEISEFFDAPVCMEYGSVECGVMAYTQPSDGLYHTFWHTHLLQCAEDKNGCAKNIVTRLVECYVPIIRYDIGDYLELRGPYGSFDENSVLTIKDVMGRPSEMLKFSCGVSFFGALVGDCVKQVPAVIASQIAVDADKNILEIRVVANGRIGDAEKNLIRSRFQAIVSNSEQLNLTVRQVDELWVNAGGKPPRIVNINS
ncbi:MAG: hypothetical protein K6F50_08810 [Kiritimatiellae bacterium]|nr:hypothetical protein [Kiritimatiellia bacterium]